MASNDAHLAGRTFLGSAAVRTAALGAMLTLAYIYRIMRVVVLADAESPLETISYYTE